jgi:hypothetical protein
MMTTTYPDESQVVDVDDGDMFDFDMLRPLGMMAIALNENPHSATGGADAISESCGCYWIELQRDNSTTHDVHTVSSILGESSLLSAGVSRYRSGRM